MGPSSRRRTKPSSRRRALVKKNQEKSTAAMNSPVKSSCDDSSSEVVINNGNKDDFIDVSNSNSACSTPKAERFRIPEIRTCPPAPKKRRILKTSCNSFQRSSSPVAFFASPDIEIFFYFALRGISV